MKNCSILVLSSILMSACGESAPSGSEPKLPANETGSSLQKVTPDRNVHLRAAFDADPSVYVGRFVTAGTAQSDLDENHASKTVCSQFFTAKEVAVDEERDELIYASSQAAASIGVISTGAAFSADGSTSKGSVVRVHYKIKKKIQVDSKPDQLLACCTQNVGQCSNQVIGEFLMGSGEIFTVTESAREGSASLGVPPVAAKATASDSTKWKKVQTFNDMYFAFLPTSAAVPDEKAAKAAAESCDFCRNIPQSDKGLFFCGVSSPAASESAARTDAMADARLQVVKYLGDQIVSKSSSLSSTAKGLLTDEHFTQSVSKGLTSRVENQKFCSEKGNSPDHPVVYKVLSYVSNDALADAATRAVDDSVAATGSKVKPADAAAAKEAAKKAASK